MSNAVTSITRQFSTPYLTIDEYKDAPTAIDYTALVVGSLDPAAQDAELANVIARASSWIDTYCNQVLGATVETEQLRTRVRPDGTLSIHPRYWPVIALTALSYGSDPNNMTAVPDCSLAWLEDQQIIYPASQLGSNMSSQGPLSFGFPSTIGAQVYTRFTYVNGYANTTIATATAGATSLTVADADGITPGLAMKIYDGMKSENVTVASSYVFGSTTVPVNNALAYTHSAGVSISALPPSVKEAAILVTTAFLKARGDSAMIMSVSNAPGQAVEGSQKLGQDLTMAQDLLKPLRRIR